MKTLLIYEKFDNWGEEQDPKEILQELLDIEGVYQDIVSFFKTRGLIVEEDGIYVDGPTEITVNYSVNSFGGDIPPKISYYIDEICKLLEENIFGQEISSWGFGMNGNCNMVTFILDDELDPKYVKYRKFSKTI